MRLNICKFLSYAIVLKLIADWRMQKVIIQRIDDRLCRNNNSGPSHYPRFQLLP